MNEVEPRHRMGISQQAFSAYLVKPQYREDFGGVQSWWSAPPGADALRASKVSSCRGLDGRKPCAWSPSSASVVRTSHKILLIG